MSAPEPSSHPSGVVASWVNLAKGLTPTNAVVIVILVAALLPAYVAWKLINDQSLLDRIMSDYNVYTSQMSSCTLRSARQRGEPMTYFLTTGFAYEGEDRWMVGVALNQQPNTDELSSYCEVLNLVVDYMRNPEQVDVPTFPGTDNPVIWQYRDKGGSRNVDEKAP